MGRKPQRLSLLISRCIRSRSSAEVKPHQEGEAYIKYATVVALKTSCSCGVGRPWQRRTLRAQQEESQEPRTWPKCSLIPRSEEITTPRTRRKDTRSAPLIIAYIVLASSRVTRSPTHHTHNSSPERI